MTVLGYIAVVEKVVRWGSRLQIDWKPVLAFQRRRLAYIDWLEDLDPIAFIDEDDVVGVAPRNSRERLSVTRYHAQIDLRNPPAKPDVLRGVFDGAIEHMAPSQLRVAKYRGHWSMPLTANYDTVRRAFVRQLLPVELKMSGVNSRDGAYLMEGDLDGDDLLFEFGVVDAKELEERVRNPDDNRLGGMGFPPPVMLRDYRYPACSLYLDVSWTSATNHAVTSSIEVLGTHADLEKKITNLVRDLAGSLQ